MWPTGSLHKPNNMADANTPNNTLPGQDVKVGQAGTPFPKYILEKVPLNYTKMRVDTMQNIELTEGLDRLTVGKRIHSTGYDKEACYKPISRFDFLQYYVEKQ